jgi:hypothetical protein
MSTQILAPDGIQIKVQGTRLGEIMSESRKQQLPSKSNSRAMLVKIAVGEMAVDSNVRYEIGDVCCYRLCR